MPFYLASPEEIREGKTTDIYFLRTKEILRRRGVRRRVVAEVSCGGLPEGWEWAVLCGVEEVVELLKGKDVDVDAIPEGVIFKPRDERGVKVPVLNIKGYYDNFCEFETPLLGLICQATGIATRAARLRLAAGEKLLLSFGVRRMHPAIAPMIDRAAYIGGFDCVSCVLSAEKLGLEAIGTMPHALILLMGDQREAWRAFDEVVPKGVKRVALIDTWWDEKFEALEAAKLLGKRLYAVRLDTPSSRRGEFEEIINEVRWELNRIGCDHVRILVSGGLNEELVGRLAKVPVDGFGVGTYLSNSPTVDFAMNVVEVEGEAVSKRGVYSGEKQVYRCDRCFSFKVQLSEAELPRCCGVEMKPLLKPLLRKGKLVEELPSTTELRERVLDQLKTLSASRRSPSP